MFILVLILIVCFIICLFFKPANSFVILFPLIIFYPRILPQIQVLGGAHGDDLILLIMFIFIILKNKGGTVFNPVSKWVLGLLVLQLIGLLSGIITDNITHSMSESLKLEFKSFRLFIYATIVSLAFVNRKEIENLYFTLLSTFFAAFVIMIVINLYPSLGLQSIWLRPHQILRYNIAEAGTERFAGVLAGVWNAGAVGEIVTVFCVSSIFSNQKINIFKKSIFYILPATSFFALALSATRTGSILILFGILLILFYNMLYAREIKFLISFCGISGIAYCTYHMYSRIYHSVGYKLISRLENFELAFYQRKTIWLEVLHDAYPKGIIFGVGNAGTSQYTHSLYVWILAALGLVGVFYFMTMMVAVIRGLSWMKKVEVKSFQSRKFNMRLALIFMITCLAIHGLVDSIGYYSREVIVIFSTMAYKWYSIHEGIIDENIQKNGSSLFHVGKSKDSLPVIR